MAVSFDELGLTDNKNPFGLISFLHPFIDLLSSGKYVNNNNSKHTFIRTRLKMIKSSQEKAVVFFDVAGRSVLLPIRSLTLSQSMVASEPSFTRSIS